MFDLQELMEATNLHNRLKEQRDELRATQRLNFEALELQHAKERVNHPQTPELIARQKAEFIASQQAFQSFHAKLDAHQKAEREQFERAHNGGALSKLAYEEQVRDMEIRHEKEIDEVSQRNEAQRIEQKFRHLGEQVNADGGLNDRQQAAEQALLQYHKVDLATRHQRHAKERRELEHRFNSARAQSERARQEDVRQRESVARATAVKEIKPAVNLRVPATLAVVAALKEHALAEQAHREALELKQKDSSEAALAVRPPLSEHYTFNKKSLAAEVLANARVQSGGAVELIDNDRARAAIFADEAGQDAGMDIHARRAVERDWISKEFAYAQTEIARREALLVQSLESINSHLAPEDKIYSGNQYEQIVVGEGEVHDPRLEDIERVAARLYELQETEEQVRAFELEHGEWMQEQKSQTDPRIEAMAEVKEQIEAHRTAETEHKVAMQQSGEDDTPSLEQLRDERLARLTVARDKALEAAAQSPYVKMQTTVANSDFARQASALDRDYQAAVKLRAEFEAKEERPWRDAALAVEAMQRAEAEHRAEEADNFSVDSLVEPRSLIAIHEVRDIPKFESLVADMKENGWTGRPILAFQNANDGEYALTGSHRIAAAREADILVPVKFVDEDKFLSQIEEEELPNGLNDVVGAGDDRVMDFLRHAGDNESAELMRVEIAANDRDDRVKRERLAAEEIELAERQQEVRETPTSLEDQYRTDVRGMESDRDQELQEVQQAWDDKIRAEQDQGRITDMTEDRNEELGEVKGEHQQLIDQRTQQFEQDKIVLAEKAQQAETQQRQESALQEARAVEAQQRAEAQRVEELEQQRREQELLQQAVEVKEEAPEPQPLDAPRDDAQMREEQRQAEQRQEEERQAEEQRQEQDRVEQERLDAAQQQEAAQLKEQQQQELEQGTATPGEDGDKQRQEQQADQQRNQDGEQEVQPEVKTEAQPDSGEAEAQRQAEAEAAQRAAAEAEAERKAAEAAARRREEEEQQQQRTRSR